MILKLWKRLCYRDNTHENVKNTHHPGSDAVCQNVNLNELIGQTRLALLVD